MPFIVTTDTATIETLGEEPLEATIEIVPRNCKLKPYQNIDVPSFTVSGEMIAYASPDSTFAVTKMLLDAAQKTIVIGIYDFTAAYIADLLKDALARSVRITLMLDTDHVKGEDEIFKELATLGVVCVSAPSCASEKQNAHYFRSSHEKVIVIDNEICMIQSGNFSKNSIPLNVGDGVSNGVFRTGNRDMGIAVRSKALAKFLVQVLKSDMQLELNAPEDVEAALEIAPPPFLVEKAPSKGPSKLFPSKTFKLPGPLAVQPVLSPDNYMHVVPGALKKAMKSVLIQQQYIHSADAPIADLLAIISEARDDAEDFDIRILLGKIFDDKALAKERENLANIAKQYDLKIGRNIRYVDTTRFVHCHNKLVIIDGMTVLVSSQNWLKAAVLENREAGLLLTHKGLASYFTDIFEEDWKVGQTKLPSHIEAGGVTPETLSEGGFVEVAAADYQQL